MRPGIKHALFTAGVCASMLLTSCGPVKLAETRDAVFSQAVEANLESSDVVALAAGANYLKGASPEDPKYDRALRLMAESAERVGLSYASSLWYLEIARARRDPAIVGQAIDGLAHLLATYPIDKETVLSGYIATAEITGLSEQQQGFIAYNQGLDSMRRGLQEWAVEQFAQIPPRSTYALRARYVLLVRELALGNFAEAESELADLREARNLPEDLALDIDRTLARIAFDQGRWGDALDAYEKIRASAPDDPELLLELAWTHYYLGEYQRSLGLLVALDAPAYRGLIAPERYLLEALALRKLCQFEPARRAAVRLRSRHGDAIDDLYAGIPLLESKPLRQAARLRPNGLAVAGWRARLDHETELIEKMRRKLGDETADSLLALYEVGKKEAARREDAELDQEMIAVSNELLGAEEGVRLILHELGVALLRGRKRGDGASAAQAETTVDETTDIAYLFVDEFWTDELDDIVVRIEDRCID